MKWKRLVLDNFGTKLMAFVLALLLWVYLYNESTASDEFDVAFVPTIGETELASREFLTSDDRPVGETIRVKLTGPKGSLNALSGVRCSPRYDKSLFGEPHATFTRELTERDLNLPEGFRATFKPSARITVRYVKFKTQKVKVVLQGQGTVGSCLPGFEVESVTPSAQEVEIRHPASRPVTEALLKRIPIHNRAASFPEDGQLDVGDPQVTLRAPIKVEVKIRRHKDNAVISIPLHLAGTDSSVLSRVELITKTVDVKIVAPDDALLVLKSNPGTGLYAFAVLDLDRTTPKGDYDLKQIYCVVRNEQYRDEVSVVVPADTTAKVKVVKEP